MYKAVYILSAVLVLFCVFVTSASAFGVSEAEKELDEIYLSAKAYLEAGRHAEAIEIYERALKIQEAKYGKDHPNIMVINAIIQELNMMFGNSPEVKRVPEQVTVDSIEFFDNDIQKILWDAEDARKDERYTDALELYKRVLKIQEDKYGKNHPGTLAIAGIIDRINLMLEKYKEIDNIPALSLTVIVEFFSTRLQLFKSMLMLQEMEYGKNHPETLAVVGIIDEINSIINDYKDAKKYSQSSTADLLKAFSDGVERYKQALKIQEAKYGKNLKVFAANYEIFQDMDAFIGFYTELGKDSNYSQEDLIRDYYGVDTENDGIYLSNTGFTYMGLGEYEKAKEYFERALPELIKLYGEEDYLTFTSMENLAIVYHALKDYAKAQEYYGRMLVVVKNTKGMLVKEINILGKLGRLYNEMGQNDAANLYMKMGVNKLQWIRAGLSNQNELNPYYIVGYYNFLADLLIEQGRIAEALQVLRMIKEEEYFEFIRRVVQNDPRLTTVSYSKLEQGQADRFDRMGRQLQDLYREKDALQKSGKDPKRLSDIDIQLNALTNEFLSFLNQVESNLKTASKEQTPEEAIAFLGDLQETLKTIGHDAALVHTLITPTRVWLVLTTPDAPPKPFMSDIPQEELFAKIIDFWECLENPSKNPIASAKELYDILLGPIAEDLEKAGTKTLMFYLDGALRYVPVSALHDGVQWLIEKYAVTVYTDAARENLQSRQKKMVWEAAAFGVTKAHQNLSALPAVKDELESIIRVKGSKKNSGIIPGIIRLDKDFTESSLIDSLNKGVPVVHIASHFRLEPGSIENSFLLLGDGKRLTLEKIHSGAFKFGKVEQFTLSACNTAIHVEENAGMEMEGLGVLAQKQGAKSVIATLWAINDKSTGVFMPRFYELLQEDGITKAEALRQAQIDFIKGKYHNPEESSKQPQKTRGTVIPIKDDKKEAPQPGKDYSHPYFWAPFILMGNWL